MLNVVQSTFANVLTGSINPLLHSKVAEAHLKVKLSQGHPAGEMIELGVESKPY